MLLLATSPVFAISNPASLDFGLVKAFYNVLETGDMLFLAEVVFDSAYAPVDYDASEAYIFDILNVAGTATYASTPLNDYGNRPIGIYLTKTRVDTLGMTPNIEYKVRVSGNPLIFPSQTGNTVIATMDIGGDTGHWINQTLGADSDPPEDNLLRNNVIQIAHDMEDYDTPTDAYLVDVEGHRYLTSVGANLLLAGIPNLNGMCQIAFQTSIAPITGDPQENTGTYALTLTPSQKWGNTIASGLTNLGLYLGIGQALAGSVILFIVAISLAIFIYTKTESGVVVLLLIAATPILGAYLGLMPIALAFVMVIMIVVLLGYFFLSRGVL
jgi:hypothetical protein